MLLLLLLKTSKTINPILLTLLRKPVGSNSFILLVSAFVAKTETEMRKAEHSLSTIHRYGLVFQLVFR